MIRRTLLQATLSITLGAAALALLPAQAAHAEDLRIGLAADVTSMDPHWNNSGPNNAIAPYLRVAGVHGQERALHPGLALSWKPVNAITWEIKLRPNVKWHDGSPFTSEDVKASLERPEKLTNAPGSFTSYTKPIARIDTPDADRAPDHERAELRQPGQRSEQRADHAEEDRRGPDPGRFRFGQGDDRHRAVQVRALRARPGNRDGEEPDYWGPSPNGTARSSAS
jgi:hypothetical protein